MPAASPTTHILGEGDRWHVRLKLRMSSQIIPNDVAASTAAAKPLLLEVLRKVDRSSQTFRATNRDGYLVDLIKS
jgi:hypothetical protein